MVKQVKEHMAEMGATGAGLICEEEIIRDTPNVLATKWGECYTPADASASTSFLDDIKLTCPWFWKLKELIGECPNVVPVGLGNNNTDIDVSILAMTTGDEYECDDEQGL